MKNKPVLFSEHFNVDKARMAELGVFNPMLNFDTKVFVEPLLLKASSSEIIQQSFVNYNKFFTDLLFLLQASKDRGDRCWREAQRRVKFPEYKYTCIGYGSDSINGSGSGAELNYKILQSAKEIVDFAQDKPDIFLLLPLLEEGIGGDIISDMTQNIIDDDICKYTVDVIAKLGIKGTHRYKSRSQTVYYLPYNPYHKCPIKILPLDILSNLPMADTFDDWIVNMANVNKDLRDAVNKNIGDAWFDAKKSEKKETILELLKKDKEFFLVILKTLQDHDPEHYDLEKDYEGLHRWLEDSKQFIKLEATASKFVEDSVEAISPVVESIIRNFKALIENKELWRIFWTVHSSKLTHVKEFYSQMLFYMVSKSWLSAQDSNINIDRVLNKETKHINFKFSVSRKCSVIVEIKHSNNYGGLEKGYLKQVEFCNNKQAVKSFYVVMDFEAEQSKQLKAIKDQEEPCSKIIEIDAGQENPEEFFGFELPELGNMFTEFETDFLGDSRYEEEKRKGGANSYQAYKPLRSKVEELCKAEIDKGRNASALQLCNAVAKIIEDNHPDLLKSFLPYKNFEAEGVDWTKPTFYSWCNKIYKSYKPALEIA